MAWLYIDEDEQVDQNRIAIVRIKGRFLLKWDSGEMCPEGAVSQYEDEIRRHLPKSAKNARVVGLRNDCARRCIEFTVQHNSLDFVPPGELPPAYENGEKRL